MPTHPSDSPDSSPRPAGPFTASVPIANGSAILHLSHRVKGIESKHGQRTVRKPRCDHRPSELMAWPQFDSKTRM